MKMDFFKNNQKIEIKKENIIFDKKNLTLIKKEDDYNIKLDFKFKKCIITIPKENFSTEIEILNMDYQIKKNIFVFTYELIGEKRIKNKIVITS